MQHYESEPKGIDMIHAFLGPHEKEQAQKHAVFSQHLHFQNTVEVKAYPLEVRRMSPPFVLVG